MIGGRTVALFDHHGSGHHAADRLEDRANMFGTEDLRDGKSWVFDGVGLGTKHWGLVSRLPCFLEGKSQLGPSGLLSAVCLTCQSAASGSQTGPGPAHPELTWSEHLLLLSSLHH